MKRRITIRHNINKLLAFFSIISICALCGAGPANADQQQNDDEIKKIEVFQRQGNIDCGYIGETAINVHFRLTSADFGQIEVKGSIDDQTYHTIMTREIEKGRGSSLLVFDAGACLSDIDITINAD